MKRYLIILVAVSFIFTIGNQVMAANTIIIELIDINKGEFLLTAEVEATKAQSTYFDWPIRYDDALVTNASGKIEIISVFEKTLGSPFDLRITITQVTIRDML